jgi:hypothetical protein
LVGVDGDWDIKINSTYRNPERNERVVSAYGGSKNSRHQTGNAIDIGLVGYSGTGPPTGDELKSDKAKKAFIAWTILTENRPSEVQMMQLERTPTKPMIRLIDTTVPPFVAISSSYMSEKLGRDIDGMTTDDEIPNLGDDVPDGFMYFDHFHVQAESME